MPIHRQGLRDQRHSANAGGRARSGPARPRPVFSDAARRSIAPDRNARPPRGSSRNCWPRGASVSRCGPDATTPQIAPRQRDCRACSRVERRPRGLVRGWILSSFIGDRRWTAPPQATLPGRSDSGQSAPRRLDVYQCSRMDFSIPGMAAICSARNSTSKRTLATPARSGTIKMFSGTDGSA